MCAHAASRVVSFSAYRPWFTCVLSVTLSYPDTYTELPRHPGLPSSLCSFSRMMTINIINNKNAQRVWLHPQLLRQHPPKHVGQRVPHAISAGAHATTPPPRAGHQSSGRDFSDHARFKGSGRLLPLLCRPGTTRCVPVSFPIYWALGHGEGVEPGIIGVIFQEFPS